MPGEARLQWGLRLSTEEGRRGLRRRKRMTSFNGASVFQRRKADASPVKATEIPLASMGPPSFNGGRSESIRINSSRHETASMGPPSFNGGRKRGSPIRVDAWRGFNGASVFQRRKGENPARSGPQAGSFNGASVFQRRKAGKKLWTVGALSSFNGASVFQRRKAPPSP